MSEIISNTQTQQLTNSDNGRNVMPVLISDSHFFIESEGQNSFSQNNNQKFGAISTTQFRTTSKITFSGTKKIYAICQGQTFIVPQQGNSNKINLILRPYKQPIPELSIKYFIYRGLNKSDFFDSANKVLGEGVDFTNYNNSFSGFINYVRKEFHKFYENDSDGIPSFDASMIGFSEGTDQLSTDLIDSYFFAPAIFDENTQEESNSFEFPLVPKGTFLGNAQSELGLDIVLNKGDYYVENDPNPFQFNLAFARSGDHVLDTNNGNTDYLKKLIKESCVQFMDVAAFYGLHCNGNGKLAVTSADVTTQLSLKDSIYSHLENFETKNTLYLYIQSNRQRSYNFYENYVYSSNNIKIGVDENNFNEQLFGTLGWPLHVVNNQENVFIQLITDNHEGVGLYVKLGTIQSEHEQNFVREENLLKTPSTDENNPLETKYTKSISFKLEKVNLDVISQPIQLIYEGVQLLVSEYLSPAIPGEPLVEPRQFILKDIDDVFGLLNATSFTQPKANVIELPSVLEHELQLVNFPNTQQGNDIGVVKTKRIADTIAINETENIQRVTYETLLFTIKNNTSSYNRNNSSSIDKSAAGTHSFSQKQNNFYQPSEPYYFKTQIFTDNGETITGLQLETSDGSLPTKKILGLTENEYQQLLDLIVVHNSNNCKVFFLDTTSNESYVSSENINYKRYILSFVGENDEGNLLIYSVIDSESNLPFLLYSIDDYVFLTDTYGKYIPDTDLNGEKYNENDIEL